MLLHFDDEAKFAQALTNATGLDPHVIIRHRFPDGELKLTLPARLPERVFVLRSLHHPNEKLIELLLVARTARELGARELVLVAPYLGYMRQDHAFHPGEAVSQQIVGRFLSELFDAVLTVDPHLHRIGDLTQALPCRHAVALGAAALVAPLVASRAEAPIFLGPDEEAAQWVRPAAGERYQWSVCRKLRTGDREVDVILPGIDVRGRAVLLIDDVASTGRTLLRTVIGLWAAGATAIDVFVTHGVFVGDALPLLYGARVGNIWSSDTVPHRTNAVSVVPLLAGAIASLP